MSDRLTQNHYQMFGDELTKINPLIAIVIEPQIPFVTFSSNLLCNMHLGGRQTQEYPLNTYDSEGCPLLGMVRHMDAISNCAPAVALVTKMIKEAKEAELKIV